MNTKELLDKLRAIKKNNDELKSARLVAFNSVGVKFSSSTIVKIVLSCVLIS